MEPIDYQNRDQAKKETGFLRSLFGPSRKEVWNQFAAQMGAAFVDGGFFGRDKVVAMTDQWTITLDTYQVSNGKSSTTYTRIRAPYVNRDGFRFKLYRTGIFTGIGKFFGMQDIVIGEPLFDEQFVIQGNNEQKVRELLSNERIRSLFQALPRVQIEVKDDEGWFATRFPEGVDELYYVTFGVVKDIEMLRNTFDLFSEILHQLCHIGSAYENDPGIRL